MSETLKLVVLFDARHNTYMVWDHNLSPDKAEAMARDLRAKLLHAFTVDQRTRHAREDAEACRLCRKDVRLASGLTPCPRFQRRNPE